MCNWSELPSSAHLERDVLNNRLHLFRRKFICDGEAWCLTCIAKRLLFCMRFNLQYDTVNLIINFFSRISIPFLPIREHVFKSVSMTMFRIHRQSKLAEICKLFTLRLWSASWRIRRTRDIIEKRAERSLRCNLRVQLAYRAC